MQLRGSCCAGLSIAVLHAVVVGVGVGVVVVAAAVVAIAFLSQPVQ